MRLEEPDLHRQWLQSLNLISLSKLSPEVGLVFYRLWFRAVAPQLCASCTYWLLKLWTDTAGCCLTTGLCTGVSNVWPKSKGHVSVIPFWLGRFCFQVFCFFFSLDFGDGKHQGFGNIRLKCGFWEPWCAHIVLYGRCLLYIHLRRSLWHFYWM